MLTLVALTLIFYWPSYNLEVSIIFYFYLPFFFDLLIGCIMDFLILNQAWVAGIIPTSSSCITFWTRCYSVCWYSEFMSLLTTDCTWPRSSTIQIYESCGIHTMTKSPDYAFLRTYQVILDFLFWTFAYQLVILVFTLSIAGVGINIILDLLIQNFQIKQHHLKHLCSIRRTRPKVRVRVAPCYPLAYLTSRAQLCLSGEDKADTQISQLFLFYTLKRAYY